ncbi:GL26489 [Drosophila persimilis]|uniref:DAZ-associated protein 2 n=2 Tax=pseudoobscura subgroup TaxID=32358 RepID=B5DJI4_DROPS|nr:DAZ-associated protein 2 [Drosophila persimilis]XP_002133054.1 DAZ-associated protein 2 [Drosophila pseudoobscura]XP_017151916.2 DAZ-associated protein 2 [Drosophila miranda]EDW25331.1 GL26489 [Drosophila persimilis]
MSNPPKGNPLSEATAPSYKYCNAADSVAMRAPPPTYEESQRNSGGFGHQASYSSAPGQNQYYGMISHNQQVPFNTQPSQGMGVPVHHGTGYGLAGPSTSAGAAAAQVLQLDSRAEVRTTPSGSVVIPPPPPGCLPTPAQWAAMQGQPVVLKQKKRSFF